MRRKAYPPTINEKIHYISGIQPVEQEQEYVYKVHCNIKAVYTNTVGNLNVTKRATWYFPEKDLLRDLQETKHQPADIDPARLKQIVLHDLWSPVPQEEVDKLAASADPDGRPFNAPGRKWRQFDQTLRPLMEYLHDLAEENVMYFIQEVPGDIYTCPMGIVKRIGNDIFFEIVFNYTQPDESHEFGTYSIEKPDLSAIEESPEKPHPNHTISPFSGGDIIKIGTGAPVRSSSMAYSRPDLWGKDDKGLPVYSENLSDGTIITHCIVEPEELEEAERYDELAARAWNIVDNFDIETGYINLLFTAYATETAKPWEEPFTIRGTDIIKDLGWCDRKTKKSDLLKKAYVKIKKDICSLNTGGIWKIRSDKIRVGFGKHWDFRWEELEGQQLFSGLPDPMTEFWITILPGEWTKFYLNKEGEKDRSALYHFGYIAKRAVQISPGLYPVAAKLAIYLTTMVKDKPMHFKVITLLEKAVPAVDMQKARNNKITRHGIKKQWDAALQKLCDIGYRIEFNENYPLALRPDWTIEKEDLTTNDLPRLPKNYWDILLASTLTIESPRAQKYCTDKKTTKQTLRLPRDKKRLNAANPMTGSMVREARMAMNMSIANLAKAMDISPTLIKCIESDTRTITKANEEKFREILKIG